MKKMIVILSLAVLVITGCSAAPKKMEQETMRAPAAEGFDLRNVYSMQRSYWSSKSADGQVRVVRFKAYVLKETSKDANYGRVIVYLEDPNNMDLLQKIVDNKNFVFQSDWAGAEPNLSLNKKDSLLIQSGNEGIGRTAWSETVTANYRNGQIAVIGYDASEIDKVGEYPGTICSVNFSTGRGWVDVYPPMAPDYEGDATPKRTNFTVPRGLKKLQDWTQESRPKECYGTK
ncbi:MAG: hypothetical protein V4736_03040 [Bdellovibrionota bacterium]